MNTLRLGINGEKAAIEYIIERVEDAMTPNTVNNIRNKKQCVTLNLSIIFVTSFALLRSMTIVWNASSHVLLVIRLKMLNVIVSLANVILVGLGYCGRWVFVGHCSDMN